MIKVYVHKIIRYFIPEFRKSYLKKSVKIHRTAQVVSVKSFDVGEYAYIGPNCFINAEGGVKLGSGSILAPEVVILSSTHDYKSGDLIPYDVYDQHRPVTIGAGVWIGYRAMICPGVTIGDGAVVAMGAVVTHSVAPGQVVGGNPAKVIAERENEKYQELISQKQFFHCKYWSGERIRLSSPPEKGKKEQ